jgi:hypothetical protein
MSGDERIPGPFGLDAERGQTFRTQRTVLAVVHSVTAGTRLADVLPLLESDHRIQVVYTRPASSLFAAGVPEFLASLGGAEIPWPRAVATPWDLAVTASGGGLEHLHAPVLKLPHGVGFSKYPRVWPGAGPAMPRRLREADGGCLSYHGRLIAAGIVVATASQLERLRIDCPPAASVAVVAGDPCLDRLLASMPRRDQYRRALGTGKRILVTVSSTWGPGSLLEQHPGLLAWLSGELPPDRYQLAVLTHPNTWYWHGPRQVRAWYSGSARRGLVIVPPTGPWRAVLAATDILVGDHGSVTSYAAAGGIPVMLAGFPASEVDPASQVARLATIAPQLRHSEPAAPQLARAARFWSPQAHSAFRAAVTSAPGRADRIIRARMYQLLDLPEPPGAPAAGPDPVPDRSRWLQETRP